MTTQSADKEQTALIGWSLSGSQPADYEVGIDRTVAHSGQASGYIMSRPYQRTGFGTLMQMCQAGQYLGQRVRMSAYVKTRAVKAFSTLWMRVDGEDGKLLSFDNMQNRPIKGTTD